MKRITVSLDDPRGGFAFIIPDIAEGARIEQKGGYWFAEFELPGGETYPVGRLYPAQGGKPTP